MPAQPPSPRSAHALKLVRSPDDTTSRPTLAAPAQPLAGRRAAGLHRVERASAPAADSLPSSLSDIAADQRRRESIARANAASAGLSPLDVRWMLAQAVSANLEQGRVAALPPEKRARLLSHASALGLRPFDASLIIAVVQDQARQGKSLDQEANARLAMIPAANADTKHRDESARLLGIACGLAIALMGVMIAWVRA